MVAQVSKIQTKPATPEYRDGWERTFGLAREMRKQVKAWAEGTSRWDERRANAEDDQPPKAS